MNSLITLLAQAPAPAPTVTTTAAGHAMGPVQIIFGLVYLIVCVLLILAILSRTTKDEGFSGSMMGGSAETSFRGAKSTEDTVDTITNGVAIAFVVLSISLNYVF